MATAKKSTAKKTTRSKTAGAKPKQVVAEVTPKSGPANRPVTLDKLYKFNLFAAAANLLFAVGSVLFVSRQTVDMTLAYATKDALSSSLGPAYKLLMSVEIRYMLAVIFVLSAVFSLLLATRLRNTYEAGVKNSTSGLRWFLSGITLGLTLSFVSAVGGIQDVLTLKLAAGLVLATSILAWMSERENKGSKKHYVAFGLSLFTGIIAWFPLVGSLIGTSLYGVVNFDAYVYFLSALVLLGFISIGLTQYKHARDGVSAQGYLQLEGKYVSVDFLIKFAVFLVVLSALHK